MQIFKPKFWDAKINIISIILWPFSLLLQVLILLKEKIIISKKFDISVICIGNIYLGGTGKTPVSILINNELERLKKKSVIIKKFYKNHIDEHRLIKKETGSLILNKKRSDALLEAKKKGYEVAILDDGFQDYAIKKDLSILCFTSKQLIGNGLILPAGPLREGLNSIKKSKILIINGNKNRSFEKKIFNISKEIRVFYSKYEPSNISEFKNKNVLAFAGIGNPINFFDILNNNGFIVKKRISFPDHYKYNKEELKKIINESKKNKLEIITTEKDYLRIKSYGFKNIKYLKIKLKIYKKKNLIKEILKYI